MDGSSPFNHVNKVAFPLDFFRFLTVPYRTFTNLVSLKPWLALVILKLALHRPIRNLIKNVNNDWLACKQQTKLLNWSSVTLNPWNTITNAWVFFQYKLKKFEGKQRKLKELVNKIPNAFVEFHWRTEVLFQIISNWQVQLIWMELVLVFSFGVFI